MPMCTALKIRVGLATDDTGAFHVIVCIVSDLIDGIRFENVSR